MPESVKDRFTLDYEYIFFFSKNSHYYFEQQKEYCVNGDPNPPRGSRGAAIPNKGRRNKQNMVGNSKYSGFNDRYTPRILRNKRAVWSIPTKGIPDAHFAVFPEELVETPIMSGCPKGGVVLDPFCGSGTTLVVAKKFGRNFIGIDLNTEYCKMAEKRISHVPERLDVILS
jgi:DNA modification methylase